MRVEAEGALARDDRGYPHRHTWRTREAGLRASTADVSVSSVAIGLKLRHPLEDTHGFGALVITIGPALFLLGRILFGRLVLRRWSATHGEYSPGVPLTASLAGRVRGELSPLWIQTGGIPVMSDRRWEKRRSRALARAEARGDGDARVRWLLPAHPRRSLGFRGSPRSQDIRRQLRRSDSVRITEERGGLIYASIYQLYWGSPVASVRRYQPDLSCFPPVFATRHGTLCAVYVVDADSGWLPSASREERNLRPVPSAVTAEIRADRVVADAGDIERWAAAADAYRAELDRAEADLIGYWVRRRRFSLSSWRQRRAFRRWRAMLTTAYDRISAAADRYRPVLDEVTDAAEKTAEAYEELTERFRRLYAWEHRKLWCMVPSGEEGFLIGRSDVLSDDLTSTVTPRGLADVYESARSERHQNLRPVDWDDESIRLSDGELAAIFGEDRPVGGVSGPAPGQLPASFAEWFRERFGFRHRSLSDRAGLERDRELREEARAAARETRPDVPSIGSYPTDFGIGHFGPPF